VDKVINRPVGELWITLVDKVIHKFIHRVWTVTKVYKSPIDFTRCYMMLHIIYRGLPCLSPAPV